MTRDRVLVGIGRQIGKAVRESGRSPEDVAREAGVNPTDLQLVIEGRVPDLTLAEAVKFAMAVGMRFEMRITDADGNVWTT